MDPNSTGSSSKYGNWDFPEGVTFPVDVRVIVKFFKVAKCDADNETRFLNTKVIKQEISLEKEDLFSKACLLKAIERDGDVKNLAHEESITNPKLEVSIKRQDSGEIFTVTKMGLVVRTLAKLVERSDTILVEVKEQIVCFQPKSPTIKITINNVRMENETAGGGKLDEKVIKSLNSALKELDKSFYDKDLKKIICGKCVSGIKLRKSGAVETLVNYFRENHFSICGKREGKRKAKEDDEVNASEKKKRKAEKMDDYWNALRKKGAEEADLKEREEVEDLFEDADLAVAGPSSSSSG